jgi:hypothetical protein
MKNRYSKYTAASATLQEFVKPYSKIQGQPDHGIVDGYTVGPYFVRMSLEEGKSDKTLISPRGGNWHDVAIPAQVFLLFL